MFFRDTWIEIDLDAIEYNLTQLKNHYVKDKSIIAVIKADAYGHGAVEVAKSVIRSGAQCLAVATLDEAIQLRLNDIHHPILVLGNVPLKGLPMASKFNIAVTVHSLEWLKKAVAVHVNHLDVQIKIDTGMHRIGILNKIDLIKVLSIIDDNPHFKLIGIYSHLATADEANPDYYFKQINKFKSLLEGIETDDLLIHLSNSIATIKYTDTITNAVRIGLMLYGVNPMPEIMLKFSLKPALALYTRIVQCKKLSNGARVSYNGIYEVMDEEWIGTIPIGYADGFDRRIKNGVVYVDNTYAPVVGHVCMDQTMIRLPRKISENTIVEMIGPHISVDDIARWSGTISYQVLTQLSKRLPRIYKRNNEIISIINEGLNIYRDDKHD